MKITYIMAFILSLNYTGLYAAAQSERAPLLPRTERHSYSPFIVTVAGLGLFATGYLLNQHSTTPGVHSAIEMKTPLCESSHSNMTDHCWTLSPRQAPHPHRFSALDRTAYCPFNRSMTAGDITLSPEVQKLFKPTNTTDLCVQKKVCPSKLKVYSAFWLRPCAKLPVV